MSKLKRILALTVALSSVCAVAGCGSAGGDASSTVTTVKKVEVDPNNADSIEAIPDSAQKEIRWMGTYNLNPEKGADKSVEMSLFNSKGGSVVWTQVTDSEKFDKLASSIMSQKDVPDIFKYEWMAFPAQILKDMYQPVDDIVDFSQPIWSDMKTTADQFVLNGKHYVAPISYAVGTLMMYDQEIIDAEGLTDPYEEYQNDNWNWDTWTSVMADFCENAPAGTERYGINGWFQTQIIQQTGKTMVNYDGNTFTNNLNDPDIERAENMLYDIGKKGYVNADWLGSAKAALKDGTVLFFCMGPWAMTGNNGPTDQDTWRIVPVPSDPNSEEKYMTADMTAYMWVRGSTANEAVKCWYECCRMANTDEQYKANGKEKFLNANPNWTEDMYQVYQDASSSDQKMMFDYGYGISSVLSDDNANEDGSCITRKLYEFTNKTDDTGKQYTWTELKNSYSATVDSELKTINNALAEYIKNDK